MSLGKHVHANALEAAVFKATQSTVETPPKPKHINTIIQQSRQYGSAVVLREIFQRGVAEKEMVSFKVLYVIHRLIREGSPRTTVDILAYKNFIDALYSQYASSRTHYGGINAAYLAFWKHKIKFHHDNAEITGDINPSKCNIPNYQVDELVALCESLFALQRGIIQTEKRILETGSLNACSVIPIPPLLLDSFNIYNLVVLIISALVDHKESEALITEFNRQYPIIQTFYFQCTTIPWIKGIIQHFPSLPAQAPKFAPTKERKQHAPKREKPAAAPQPQSPPVQPAQYHTQQTTTTVYQQQTVNPFATYSQPSFNPTPAFPQHPTFNPTPQPAYVQSNPFATNNPFVTNPTPSAAPVPAALPTNNLFAAPPANPFSTNNPKPVGMVAGGGVSIAPVLAPEPIVVQQDTLSDTNLEALKQRVRDLEGSIRQTEADIQDQKGANSELRQLLTDRSSGLTSVQKAMVDRLEQQKRDHMDTNLLLKGELQNLMAQYQEDKLALLLEQIDFAKDGVEDHIFRFDSPEYMGNRGASATDLQRAAAHLRDSMKGLLSSLQNGGDIVGVSRSVADWTNKFLDDSKGALSGVTDPNQRLQMTEGTAEAARKVMDMLSHASQLVPQGPPDEGQQAFLMQEHDLFLDFLQSVMSCVSSNADSFAQTSQQNDLEKCALQELEQSLRIVTAISGRLKEVSPSCSGAQQSVAQSILDASVAITTATSHLVGAAAHAQTERVKLLETGLAVQRDAMLTESLLGASKSVSEATRALAAAAFQASQGQFDDQALISAAHAVAASTAQLVSATRAGSNEGSDALDRAADAVTRATRSLVESARLFNNAEEMAFVEKTNVASQQVGEEIEMSAEILRLKAELEKAEKKLQATKGARQGNTGIGLETGDAAFRVVPNYQK